MRAGLLGDAARDDVETWRCPNCSRILARLRLAAGSWIEVKCRSCACFSVREVTDPASARPQGAIVGAIDEASE